jgi:hypothetical protein
MLIFWHNFFSIFDIALKEADVDYFDPQQIV